MRTANRTILLFDQYSTIGGGQTVLLAVAEAARQAAERVVLAVPKGGPLGDLARSRLGSDIEITETAGITLSHGKKGVRDVAVVICQSVAFFFRHFRQARNATLLYGNGPRQFPGLMALSLLTNRICIYHVHLNHSRLEKWIIAVAGRVPTTFKIVINSEFTYRRLVETMRGLEGRKKLLVLENGLASSFRNLRFVNRFEGKQTRWNVLVLGVVRPEKGQDMAIALARLVEEVHVHIVGPMGRGAESWFAQLRATATANVTFHDFVEDVPGYIDRESISFSLVPSRWEEPFGLVAVEAMACSCITVVSNRGGLVDIAAKTGAVVYGEHLDELVATFHELLAKGRAALAGIARTQHARTMAAYGPERFHRELSQLLTEGLRRASLSGADRSPRAL
jgi:glycosyltransferase involved in cell wall biosynthesis